MLTSAIVKMMSVLSLMLSPLYSEPWPFQAPNYWIGIIIFGFSAIMLVIGILLCRLQKKRTNSIDTAADLEAAALKSQQMKTDADMKSPELKPEGVELTVLKPSLAVAPSSDMSEHAPESPTTADDVD